MFKLQFIHFTFAVLWPIFESVLILP